MGNFHCVPSGCAEVVYQEYLPSVVRWRYPNESWQEISGANNYSVQQTKGQCPIRYKFEILYARSRSLSPGFEWSQTGKGVTTGNGPISNIYIKNLTTGQIYKDVVSNPSFVNNTTSTGYSTEFINTGVITSNGTWAVFWTEENGVEKNLSLANVPGYRAYGFTTLVANQPDNCACFFKVTKNGAIVYQESRSVCPEVEKLPCRLSDVTKRIEIRKLPYLERVDVVPYEYATYRQPGISSAPIPIVQANDIPDECLNIYKNAIYVIPPLEEALKDPNSIPFDSFVTQICSAPGCLPPEYQVLCDSCGCESCPPGTRPITCGEAVCCYGSDGKVVKEIPIENYCGGDCCCE